MGGQGGIPKKQHFEKIFFTHKTEMKAPWFALVRNILGLVSDHFLYSFICALEKTLGTNFVLQNVTFEITLVNNSNNKLFIRVI